MWSRPRNSFPERTPLEDPASTQEPPFEDPSLPRELPFEDTNLSERTHPRGPPKNKRKQPEPTPKRHQIDEAIPELVQPETAATEQHQDCTSHDSKRRHGRLIVEHMIEFVLPRSRRASYDSRRRNSRAGATGNCCNGATPRPYKPRLETARYQEYIFGICGSRARGYLGVRKICTSVPAHSGEVHDCQAPHSARFPLSCKVGLRHMAIGKCMQPQRLNNKEQAAFAALVTDHQT